MKTLPAVAKPPFFLIVTPAILGEVVEAPGRQRENKSHYREGVTLHWISRFSSPP
jgi:hypothetical protein